MRTWITSTRSSWVWGWLWALLIASATAGPGDTGCAPDRQQPNPKVEQIPPPNDWRTNEGAQGRINSTVDENSKGQGWRTEPPP